MTLRMVVLAIVLAVLLAVGSGVLSAVHQYTISDYALTFAGFLFLSMPAFWLAALLKEYGAIRLNQLLGRQWVFVVGDQSPNLTGPLGHRLADYTGHLLLPTIALAAYAGWSRFQRAAMLDVLGSDHLRLARAKMPPGSSAASSSSRWCSPGTAWVSSSCRGSRPRTSTSCLPA